MPSRQRPSDSCGSRTVSTRNTYRQVFAIGPHQDAARKLAWAEARLKQAAANLKARAIAESATAYMKLNEDEPLWKS